jgi:hypothetical protein
MKKYLIFCFCFCAVYAAGNRIMTAEVFSEIEIGMPEKELRRIAGEPYSVRKCCDGQKELEYIERVMANDRILEIRHYFFMIKGGLVNSKRLVEGEKHKPLLERNAYDLQMSYQQEE